MPYPVSACRSHPGAAPSGAAPPDPHTILTITDDGDGNALYTTAAAHGLVGGSTLISVTGASNEVYNALHGVDVVLSPTTFIEAGGYTGDSTGGTWSLA